MARVVMVVGVAVAVMVVMMAVVTPVTARTATLLSLLSRGFERKEEATFTSLRQTKDYEVRQYPEKKWVCTGQDASEDQVTVFLRLFSYIDGTNDRNERLTMGIPVSIEVHNDGGVVVMQACFFIPEASQADPPTPTDPLVSIVARPAMTVYSREFGGYALDESTWDQEVTTLKRQVEAAGNTVNTFLTFWNAYDAPIKLLGRRNEVWLVAQV